MGNNLSNLVELGVKDLSVTQYSHIMHPNLRSLLHCSRSRERTTYVYSDMCGINFKIFKNDFQYFVLKTSNLNFKSWKYFK